MQVLTFFLLLLSQRSLADLVTSVPQDTTLEVLPGVDGKPQMQYFHVESVIRYRYSTTLISTKIVNPSNVAQEVFFTAILPGTAFTSQFNIEVDGTVYEAYVKEKEEAQQIYDDAVQQGQTAAQVSLTARDSNRFTVSINIEPYKEVIFNLTYEELLSRAHKVYTNTINLDPGQIVPDFSVIVRIEESSSITTLRVPALKINEEMQTANTVNVLAAVERPSDTTAVVTFKPTPDQQREISDTGVKGQFIVEYDVDRSTNSGEILVNDGYFVHFFAPEDLPPLRKHVTFVLDLSGSMSGRPIEQLRQAMLLILDDLNSGDLFSIVLFSQTAQVWDPTVGDEENDRRLIFVGSYSSGLEGSLPFPEESVIVEVTDSNIQMAKAFVNKLQATGSTNIYDGLMLALNIAKLNSHKFKGSGPDEPDAEPIIVFLTDGMPNVRESNPDVIVSDVTNANTKKSSIFSLALGNGADENFLKKLSLQNSGFSRRIYEAADTALQLADFYQEISSPLLANVEFQYTPNQVDNQTVTTCVFRRYFAGSELVVAGKLSDIDNALSGEVQATSIHGTTRYAFDGIIIPYPPIFPPPRPPIIIHPPPVKRTPSNMERLWAYLTILQLLDEDAALDYDRSDKSQTSPQRQRALELALEYGFVTSVTSLVVVKPNEVRAVDAVDASQQGGGVQSFPAASSGVNSLASKGVIFPAADATAIGRPVLTLATDAPLAASLATDAPTILETTTTPWQQSSCLKGLDDITWLASSLTVDVPDKGVLQVAGTNETNSVFSECTTPGGETGECRHLRYCVLDDFINNEDDFFPYVCQINSYVGVCCPVNPPCP